ncbi:MAG: VWA domain-containing protein [Vicinamibacterales bacterium]
MTRAAGALATTLVLVTAATAVLPARPQQAQFRGGTDTVPVYVTVRDRDGAFVTNLTRDDFELRDNGRTVPVTQFTTASQPLSIVVLIDGSGSMMDEFSRAVEGARSLVLRLLPEDRALVGSFADDVRFSPSFTSDRDLLLSYLRNGFNLRMGLETHLWDALLQSALRLQDEPGRRAIVVLSDGYNFVTNPKTAAAATPGTNPITGKPTGATGGLPRPPAGGSISMGNLPDGDPRRNGVPAGSARGAAVARDVIVYAVSMWVQTESRSERPSRDLERMAIDTGGSFTQLRLQDEVSPAFTDIMRELRQQYVLGFTPAAWDGKEHRLEVRLRPGGLTARARRTYLASRER